MIEIEFLRSEPPEGWVRKAQGDGGALRFSGWVGLLQAVWIMANGETSGETAGRPGCQLGA